MLVRTLSDFIFELEVHEVEQYVGDIMWEETFDQKTTKLHLGMTKADQLPMMDKEGTDETPTTITVNPRLLILQALSALDGTRVLRGAPPPGYMENRLGQYLTALSK